jgi:23S rRNA (uridine2552-2'-O)-methyltransferase
VAGYKKPDFWQLKARRENYPARSVYKLAEMDEKFALLKNMRPGAAGSPFRVLDLGAAPGSWSLYVLRKIPCNADMEPPRISLVSADLAPLSRQYDSGLFDRNNFFFIQGDITTPAIREAIYSRGPYNLVISDAAPATTGNRSIDAARSLDLAGAAASYGEDVLAKGGNLVIKVFQGGDTAELLKHIKTLFNTAKSFKPRACRGESFETYYIGLGRK